jgi:hypothetical protein
MSKSRYFFAALVCTSLAWYPQSGVGGPPPRARASGLRASVQHQEYVLRTDEEVTVRFKKLPPEFDEKGKVKRRTAVELKELKGKDPRLPGYTAEFSDLKPGQAITVYLARERRAAGPAKAKGEAADADKEIKKHWSEVGKLTGQLVRVTGKDAAEAKLTLLVEGIGLGKSQGQSKQTVGNHVLVRMILILSEAPGLNGGR